jgi:hypothetical protein
MRAVFPDQPGLPIFFHHSRKVGLGLYSSKAMANAIEYGSVALGASSTCARSSGCARRGPPARPDPDVRPKDRPIAFNASVAAQTIDAGQ